MEAKTAARKIKVLIVDDSALVRKILQEEISKEADLEVAGTAPDPFIARDKIVSLRPDVVTLDLEMPRMDGLTFLRKLMRSYPLPVIIVSSLTPQGSKLALQALEWGAVEVIGKPGPSSSTGEISARLKEKIRAAAGIRRSKILSPPAVPSSSESPLSYAGEIHRQLIVMGASTGGTEALKRVLMNLAPPLPGVLVVQHMPAQFTTAFAERLNRLSPLEVREAQDGEHVQEGRVLIAPGDFHMLLHGNGGRYFVQVRDGPFVHHQKPAVDVLFNSVAQQAGPHAVGVLLTGMGMDGAQGLLKMKQAGAKTLAQDEASSVVFGMPREAIRLGAVDRVASLDQIPREILRLLSGC